MMRLNWASRRPMRGALACIVLGSLLLATSSLPHSAYANSGGAVLPVIFLHGINGSYGHWADNAWLSVDSNEKSSVDKEMKGLPFRLYQADTTLFDGIGPSTPVYVFDYSNHKGGHGDIYLAAGMLKNAIDVVKKDTGASDVYLVGFSMGGVISRTYLADKAKADKGAILWFQNWEDVDYDYDVWGLTTLDSPHRGSALCGTIQGGIVERLESLQRNWSEAGLWGVFMDSDPAEDDLGADSAFMKDLNSTPIPSGVRCAFLSGAYYDFIGDGLLDATEQFTSYSVRNEVAPRVRFEPVVHAAAMEEAYWEDWVLWSANKGTQHKDQLLGEVLETQESKDYVRSSYAWAYAQYEAEPIYSDSATSLVVDVSTSMDESFESGSKLDGAKEAAETVADIIYGYYENYSGEADIAVAAFSDTAYEVQPLTGKIREVETALESLDTIASTNILAAIEVGMEQLESSTTSDMAMFLLSDGQDTVGNTPDDIIAAAQRAASRGIKIYTIGFGDPGYLDEPVLQAIADETGGQYQWADPGMAFSVIEQFAKSQANRSGAEILFSMIGKVAQGQTADAGSLTIPPTGGLLEAFLCWPGSQLDLTLRDPSGVEVAEGYPGFKVVAGETQSQIFIENAAPGEWQVEVYGAETSMPEEPFYALASFRESTGTLPASGAGGAPASDGSELWLLLLALLGVGGVAAVLLGRKKGEGAAPAEEGLRIAERTAVGGPSLVDASGHTYALKPGANSIGRASDNDVALSDASVSRHHALLVLEGGRAMIRDLESTTGTKVDGAKLREASVPDGGTIALGEATLVLRLDTKDRT